MRSTSSTTSQLLLAMSQAIEAITRLRGARLQIPMAKILLVHPRGRSAMESNDYVFGILGLCSDSKLLVMS